MANLEFSPVFGTGLAFILWQRSKASKEKWCWWFCQVLLIEESEQGKEESVCWCDSTWQKVLDWMELAGRPVGWKVMLRKEHEVGSVLFKRQLCYGRL